MITSPDGSLGFFDWLHMILHLTTLEKRCGLSTIAVLTAWSLWRHRNAIIFDKIAPSSTSLVAAIYYHFSEPMPVPELKDLALLSL